MLIELSEGAGSFEEVITVTGAAPNKADEAPAGAMLHGRDLQALRGVMLDDPLRAVQALPAAASTNDFYSEFSVRGNGFRHVGLAIDGIPASYLIHSIHNVPDGGSIAMVNSEALGAASLLPGSYPQRLGRRLGGEVELTTRDGNRNSVHGRAGLSGTSANAIVEGPLAGGKGAWVASVRHSYLDYLLDRIDPEGSFGFGFSDALGKVTFDVNPKHQLQLLTIAGRSTFDEAPEDITVNDEAVARSRAWLAAATWRFTPGPRLAMTQRVYATGHAFSQRQRARHAPRRRRGERSRVARGRDAGAERAVDRRCGRRRGPHPRRQHAATHAGRRGRAAGAVRLHSLGTRGIRLRADHGAAWTPAPGPGRAIRLLAADRHHDHVAVDHR